MSKHNLPAIEEYERLIPVAQAIYAQTSALSWQLLLPAFLVSVAMGYTADLGISGSILLRLKRLVLVALLLVMFPMIAEFLQILGVEIAKSIDDMKGIDQILDAASKRAEAYSFSLDGLLNFGSDLLLAALTLLSYIILVVARFLLLAFQHFQWLTLVVLAPFLILCSLFESSAGVTKNLFKNMVQISCWPILWSILSAFLKALPFAAAYSTTDPGSIITVVTLNLIIAIALLLSPFLVSQFCEGVSLSIGDNLKRGALQTVSMVNPKGIAIRAASRVVGAERVNRIRQFVETPQSRPRGRR
jgi:hypothetical protein